MGLLQHYTTLVLSLQAWGCYSITLQFCCPYRSGAVTALHYICAVPTGVGLLQHYIEQGNTEEDIIKAASKLCSDFRVETPRVCYGIIQLMVVSRHVTRIMRFMTIYIYYNSIYLMIYFCNPIKFMTFSVQ